MRISDWSSDVCSSDLLLDCHRAAQTHSETSYRAFHITLPRAAVYRAMGDDPIAGIGALRTLPDTPLALLLKDQLGAFARHGPNMNAAEAAAAMKDRKSTRLNSSH